MRVLRASHDWIRELRFSPSGEELVGLDGHRVGYSGVRRHLLFDDQVLVHKFKSPSAALSPDLTAVAAFNDDHTLTVWNLLDFTPRIATGFRNWQSVACVFDPAGGLVYVLSHDWQQKVTLHRFLLSPPRELDSWRIDSETKSLALRSDGKLLATPGFGVVSLRDTQTGAQVARWALNTDVRRVTFSRDGASLVLAGGEYVQIHECATGRQRQALVGHQGPVTCLAFSPDGRILGTGSRDRTVKFWDFESGKLLRTYNWPTGPVHALTFAPDGLTAAAGGESGDIVIWDVDS